MLNEFGGWAIEKACFDFIRSFASEGSSVIELGSGYSTKALSQYYRVTSIEHDSDFLHKHQNEFSQGKFSVELILAPLVKIPSGGVWYDPTKVAAKLPHFSRLVLVDGPPAIFGREGLLEHLPLFQNTDAFIFDDVNRPSEFLLLSQVASALNKKFDVIKGRKKEFGVILLNP